MIIIVSSSIAFQQHERLDLVAHVPGRSDQEQSLSSSVGRRWRRWVLRGAASADTSVPQGTPEAFTAIREESYWLPSTARTTVAKTEARE